MSSCTGGTHSARQRAADVSPQGVEVACLRRTVACLQQATVLKVWHAPWHSRTCALPHKAYICRTGGRCGCTSTPSPGRLQIVLLLEWEGMQCRGAGDLVQPCSLP